MLVSMTGYGRAGVTVGSISATADIRALNSRYLEVQLFVPRALSAREQDIKEIIRAAMTGADYRCIFPLLGRTPRAP